MADRAAVDAWVQRVLGMEPKAKPSGSIAGIAYPKLLLRWRAAQGEAIGALERIGNNLLAMPEVQADPRYPAVQKVVARLPSLIPDSGGSLEDILDRGINAGNNKAVAAEALDAVAKYRQGLATAASLRAFEQFANAHVGELAAVRTLDGTLAELEQTLKAA